MSWFSTLAAVLLSVSAAITPLGLYTQLKVRHAEDTVFTYAEDRSPIGQATPPREDYVFNRFYIDAVYPGNKAGYDYLMFANTTSNVSYSIMHNPYATNAIATDISAAFRRKDPSDERGNPNTVAGLWDIQYRNFLHNSAAINDFNYITLRNKSYTRRAVTYYQQFLLNSKIEAIEGLIVSTIDNPSIGFRNHTLPPTSKNGFQ